ERAAVPAGGRLGLWGFGSSAHVTLQISRARGARVYVLTREPSHRELARALGAVWTGDLGDVPPEPLDSAIVFAPVGELVPVALTDANRALSALKRGAFAGSGVLVS